MIQFLTMVDVANQWAQAIFAASVTAYALTRGGPSVRGAAIVNAFGFLGGWASNYLIQPVGPHLMATCTLDAVVAAALLYFAVRHNSLWLAVGVIAQGAQLALDFISVSEWHGFSLPSRFGWSVVLNGLTDVIQISILGAALAGRRRLALSGPVRV